MRKTEQLQNAIEKAIEKADEKNNTTKLEDNFYVTEVGDNEIVIYDESIKGDFNIAYRFEVCLFDDSVSVDCFDECIFKGSIVDCVEMLADWFDLDAEEDF